ncbi:hypothetical protein VIGAN_02121800 [Vigna angularis var. angularis]|uniref:Uncharacterized protein n=1 Tax=Vigna angularis var. angularis TaxID=157739 RepID=A0A0S3RCZ5_PHAAN|nr:protein HAPLESS 2 [Vigna angularis]XP_052731789.1 protein HAPLESS 2 [Vigna angularis]BAT78530.1 hypothetical protein VIGAN_02121800 [Vigna angularis var. angularis]
MGNVIESLALGLGQAFGKLFSSPIEFLSGKSCSSVCGPTWDFMCYIENFCIANILKLAMVFMLSYIVLLFFYLVHKLGICGCLCRSSCKMTWACFSSCFHVWEYSCTFLCIKLHNIRRTRRIRRVRVDMKKKFYSGESLSHHFPSRTKMSRSISRSRDYKASHLRKSLKPRRHHARVEISRDLRCKSKRNHSLGEPSFTSNGIKHGNHRGTINDIKVIHTSKFTRKGISRRNRVLPRQRRQNLS